MSKSSKAKRKGHDLPPNTLLPTAEGSARGELHEALRQAVEGVVKNAEDVQLRPSMLAPLLHRALKVDRLLPALTSDQLVFLRRAPNNILAREHKNIALWLSVNTGTERVILPVREDCSVPKYAVLPVSAAA